MPSVAIVGFSEKTFKYVKSSKADEIWTLNYAYLLNTEIPRIDRLFEIHKRDWYLRKEVKKSKEYEMWLAQPHTFPIYMEENELTDLVPSGVRYPFEEIGEKYLSKLRIVGVDEDKGEITTEEWWQPYFTSSFAFMIAMAIYEGFDTIEIYGIDMEINTEYGYQKPCGEFWIGIALGLGITVKRVEPCALCNALVYGYDAIPYIDPPRVKELIDLYQAKCDSYQANAQVIARKFMEDPTNKDFENEYMEQSRWGYAYRGATSAAVKLIQESDTYISRQFVEIKRSGYINGMDYWKAQYNQKKTLHDHLLKEEKVDENLWREVLDSRANMFMNMGAVQLHKKLIDIMDMRPYKYELVMEISEDERPVKKETRPMLDNLDGR